jgi:CRP-like cAMP-binding protein
VVPEGAGAPAAHASTPSTRPVARARPLGTETAADAEIQAALAASPLARIPAETLASALCDTFSVDVPAGVTICRGDQSIGLSLVVRGILRLYVVGEGGRQLTVQHAQVGDLLGVPTMVGGPVGLYAQAISEVRMLRLPTAPVMALFHDDLRVAQLFGSELHRLLSSYMRELTLHALGSLRQRIIHQLLERAEPTERGSIVGRVTQQQLADATGAARESVGRVLRQLRDESLIVLMNDQVIVNDHEQLVPSSWT